MQKKILSIILAIVMIVGTFSVGAIAIEANKNSSMFHATQMTANVLLWEFLKRKTQS